MIFKYALIAGIVSNLNIGVLIQSQSINDNNIITMTYRRWASQ